MNWLRRIRGALLMGLTWAIAWAPIGLLIGMIVDSDGKMDEPWIAVGAFPGFLSGVMFAIVLGIAARKRRFSELSMPKFAIWGAGASLVLGALPFLVGSLNPALPGWFPFVVAGSITALGATSSSASLALARRAEKQEVGSGAAELPKVEGRSRDLVR